MDVDDNKTTIIRGIQEKFSKEAFVAIAAIGAAVGLGNFWRFPFIAHANGGGSFLIPYLIVTVILGLPVILLEFSAGRSIGGSIVTVIEKRLQRPSWLGWAIGLNCFVIVTYYTVVLAWASSYVYHSIGINWGTNAGEFFANQVLNRSSGPWEMGAPQLPLLFALGLIWLIIFWITSGNLRRIESVLKYTVVLPFIVVFILLIRAVTLEGSADGITRFFQPEFDKLFSAKTWSEATTQVMLSLSIGMGQLVAYSSRGRTKGVARAGLATVIGNTFFSILAGITVFATLGFLVAGNGEMWSQFGAGPGLVFEAYPAAIAQLPWGATLFGILFFMMLIFLGIDSAFAVIEANLLPIEERTNITRRRISGVLCLAGFLFGVLYTTRAGIFWLDIIDHIVAYYGILLAVIIECILLSWSGNLFTKIKASFGLSDNLSKAVEISTKWVVPVILTIIITISLISDIREPYGGYPVSATIAGVCAVALLIFVGIKFLRRVGRKTEASDTHITDQ